MTIYFVDTSALGRRYLPEVGSTWVLGWIAKASGNVVIVADLTPIEMFATLSRLQREGVFSAQSTQAFQNALLADLEQEYLNVPLEAAVLTEARDLVTRYPLRTLDAIQLACALQARTTLGEPLIFISGDNRLLTAAAAEGFAIDNPYLHP